MSSFGLPCCKCASKLPPSIDDEWCRARPDILFRLPVLRNHTLHTHTQRERERERERDTDRENAELRSRSRPSSVEERKLPTHDDQQTHKRTATSHKEEHAKEEHARRKQGRKETYQNCKSWGWVEKRRQFDLQPSRSSGCHRHCE